MKVFACFSAIVVLFFGSGFLLWKAAGGNARHPRSSAYAHRASSTQPPKTRADTYEVEYRVSGTASVCDITYTTQLFSIEQRGGASLPWKHTITMPRRSVASLTAQTAVTELLQEMAIEAQTAKVIIVEIFVDGVLFRRARSSGIAVIATVSGPLY